MTLEDALRRLKAALDTLEMAAARRLEMERGSESLETELALMRDDRSRLAVELDGALARGARIEQAAAEVSRRIDRAIASVRGALGADAPGGQG